MGVETEKLRDNLLSRYVHVLQKYETVIMMKVEMGLFLNLVSALSNSAARSLSVTHH